MISTSYHFECMDEFLGLERMHSKFSRLRKELLLPTGPTQNKLCAPKAKAIPSLRWPRDTVVKTVESLATQCSDRWTQMRCMRIMIVILVLQTLHEGGSRSSFSDRRHLGRQSGPISEPSCNQFDFDASYWSVILFYNLKHGAKKGLPTWTAWILPSTPQPLRR